MANTTYPIPIGRAGTGSTKRLLEAHARGQIPHTMTILEWWRCEFDITLAGALDADADQTFDLHTYLGSNPKKGILFPANVVRESPALVYVEVVPVGVTTMLLQLGDTGNTDALITASANIQAYAAGDWVPSTPAAAEYEPQIETAFIPTLRLITTVDDVADITAFRCTILIPFRKLPFG